jgi:hypothetical protein
MVKMAYDENPNNIFENTDNLELLIARRLKLCGLENGGIIARVTDIILDTLRGIQNNIGPITSTDNYEEVLASYLYILGGEVDGDKILSKIRDDLDNSEAFTDVEYIKFISEQK